MWFRALLLKIETGQVLTEKQEKWLAAKLGIIPSFMRTFVQVILFVAASIFLLIGLIGGKKPFSSVTSYIIAGISIVGLIIYIFLPKRFKIIKYLKAIDRFYETKFSQYDNFDLYYIGQHVNPHIKELQANKIYLLTDKYHYLFIDDYFKDTKYKMPNYLTNRKEPVYLRVIDENKTDYSKMMVRLEDVELFYLTCHEVPLKKPFKRKKYVNYYNNFFNQNLSMDEHCMVILKMRGGLIFRLSYDVYQVFVEGMPHKERK